MLSALRNVFCLHFTVIRSPVNTMQSLNKILNARPLIYVCIRNKSLNAANLKHSVVLSKDKRTVVCWHPEIPFPYEFSKPLPEKAKLAQSSVLKVQVTEAMKAIYRPKTEELKRQELMNITHTAKYKWFPCNRKFRKRPTTEMDRPYL